MVDGTTPTKGKVGRKPTTFGDKDARNREIVRLAEQEGLTYDEIGVRLGISRQRAWRIHKRAKEAVA